MITGPRDFRGIRALHAESTDGAARFLYFSMTANLRKFLMFSGFLRQRANRSGHSEVLHVCGRHRLQCDCDSSPDFGILDILDINERSAMSREMLGSWICRLPACFGPLVPWNYVTLFISPVVGCRANSRTGPPDFLRSHHGPEKKLSRSLCSQPVRLSMAFVALPC